jgi:hypothetical protein
MDRRSLGDEGINGTAGADMTNYFLLAEGETVA